MGETSAAKGYEVEDRKWKENSDSNEQLDS